MANILVIKDAVYTDGNPAASFVGLKLPITVRNRDVICADSPPLWAKSVKVARIMGILYGDNGDVAMLLEPL